MAVGAPEALTPGDVSPKLTQTTVTNSFSDGIEAIRARNTILLRCPGRA
ncbi:hypothetical protein [Streptomyces hirsutus]